MLGQKKAYQNLSRLLVEKHVQTIDLYARLDMDIYQKILKLSASPSYYILSYGESNVAKKLKDAENDTSEALLAYP